MGGNHSIRIPVHGFVEFDDWERDVINHPVFQRLRRIRQLAFSDHVYPGANHSRFEHSLGVMHVATRLFESVLKGRQALLNERLQPDAGLNVAKRLVRIAALLHDVGHAPFSHVSEDLMPESQNGAKFKHEDYSAEIIEHELNDVIDGHPSNDGKYRIRSIDVADLLRGRGGRILPEFLFWRVIVVGQLDADRMDYLLRDSLHCGVEYGRYDLDRVIDTLTVVENRSDELHSGLQLAVSMNGRHAAEGLILARYFMFQQVYFHHVRKAYDYHAAKCLEDYLLAVSGSPVLPIPVTKEGRRTFLSLDDWVLARHIHENAFKNRHAEAIISHKHDRKLATTPEKSKTLELRKLTNLLDLVRDSGIEAWVGDADKDWYRSGGASEILIADDNQEVEIPVGNPLSECSTVLESLEPTKQRVLYVPRAELVRAKLLLEQ